MENLLGPLVLTGGFMPVSLLADIALVLLLEQVPGRLVERVSMLG